MKRSKKILVTGGAGYIGSSLVAALLDRGDQVLVLDNLLFGAESLLPFFQCKRFRLIKGDVSDNSYPADCLKGVDCLIHLAALVGFPACDKVGRRGVWRVNVNGTKNVYQAAVRNGVPRLIFASSYSSYGESAPGQPVTEDSPLHPKSSYAESKIEAEHFLLHPAKIQATGVVCLRLATVFGVSPRTRFDLILNQFVLDAYSKGRLEIYQKDFKRSFVHVRDVVRAMLCVADAPLKKVRNQVFNVGSEQNNTSKRELVQLIQADLPRLKVKYRRAAFAGDMRSIHVSFEKIRRQLGFKTRVTLAEGIHELVAVLQQGIISDPDNIRFRNHPPILV